MSAGKPAPLVIHGWTVFAHPLFLAQLEALAQQVESLKKKDLVSCHGSNAACSLALKPDGVVASRRHSPSYDSSSRLASGLDGGAIKRHLSPDTTLAGYAKKNASKRLAAITKLAFDVIPQDPTRPEYRQGNTLGEDHKHWFRAKFFQQYRLFFRYHAPSKVIVFAWVNDEDTKRAYESSDDAYRVFRKMLESGHPPDDWNQLLAEAR